MNDWVEGGSLSHFCSPCVDLMTELGEGLREEGAMKVKSWEFAPIGWPEDGGRQKRTRSVICKVATGDGGGGRGG